MVRLDELLYELASELEKSATENARFDAQQLLFAATGLDKLAVITAPETAITEETAARARELLKRRKNGEPLQYLLGEWEFYGFPFKVGEGVLIPRQDTETLVELVKEHLSSDSICADLCAGSGCIGISLAKLTGCRADCYELSDSAMGYLKKNIALNGADGLVKPIAADVLSDGTVQAAPEYDAVVSNPPYLTAEDMKSLQTEVTYEPEMALYGGEDGLELYKSILKKWTARLRNGGLFAVEIGAQQAEAVSRIFTENGISPCVVQDYCGNDRVVYGVKR